MPNSRHQRNHRHREDDAHNNNQHAPSVCLREVAAGTPTSATGNHAHQNDNAGARLQKCCSPGVCRSPDDTIDPDEPFDAVKVLCNNESCTEGKWMHKDCFEDFEQSVLAYLRSCGRARSWSEKQRLQNLWTKKGYDLAFKACDCRCGRGHLRKDLDYFPAPFNENAKKHKKHKKKNDKPMPVVSTTHKANSHSSHTGHVSGNATTTSATTPSQSSGTRGQPSHAVNSGGRCGEKKSKKSTTTMTTMTKTPHAGDSNGNLHQHHFQETLDNHSAKQSEATTTFTNHTHTLTNGNNNNSNVLPVLPSSGHHHNPQLRIRTNSVSSTCSAGSHSSSSSSSLLSSAGSPSPISSSPTGGEMFFKSRKSSDASSDGSTGTPATIPTTSSITAGFRYRVDLSAFAALPRNKQNPYHIRMEDCSTLAYSFTSCSMAAAKAHALAEVAAEAGSCDLETRNFVLSNLMSKKMSHVRCALCKVGLPVFDRFPLLDGTFFLSPQSYDESAIQVIWDGRLQFLNAACLSCLEGHNNVKCVACKRPWNGGNLVVGSMYTYDIFAASPCCQKRLTCKCCLRAVVDITKGLEFYSQYSQMIICPYCKANDYHFIRSLLDTFTMSEDSAGQSVAICH